MPIADTLTKLRRKEQERCNYPASSKWYIQLKVAINLFEEAEKAVSSHDKFRSSWFAIYQLSRMLQERGMSENQALDRWIDEAKHIPLICSVASETPQSLLKNLLAAKKHLLWNPERETDREAVQIIESWIKRRAVTGEQACQWILRIGRDLRNVVSHPPSGLFSPSAKKAMSEVAPLFFKLAEAAIRANIRHPPQGSTGRTAAYRSFLFPYLRNIESNFSDYYLEHLFKVRELDVFAGEELKPMLRILAQEYGKLRDKLQDAGVDHIKREWVDAHLLPCLSEGFTAHVRHSIRIIDGNQIYQTDYAIARETTSNGAYPREYKGKQAGRDLCCLIFLLSGRDPHETLAHTPTSVEPTSGMPTASPQPLTVMGLAQQALLASEVPWAILTNGTQFWLTAKSTAHKLYSFFEIDLDAILERYKQPEAQEAFGFFRGFFATPAFLTKDSQGLTRLERAVSDSEQHGAGISKELKENVFNALRYLGEGFLDRLRRNPQELEDWLKLKAPDLTTRDFLKSDTLLQDIYHGSLALMYRLLFLLYAESRDLLPMEKELYRETYSLEDLRDLIRDVYNNADVAKSFFSRGETELWERLQQLFRLVDKGSSLQALPIPSYNGGLFDPEKHEFLEQLKISDYFLARAIDLISRTRPGSQVSIGGRKKVTYRDLEIRHLGSIYEGILEYHARIAETDLAVIEQTSGGKKVQEYKPITELTTGEQQHFNQYQQAYEENPEFPNLSRCKVKSFIAAGQYYLVFGGRESKRKSSGSYYTPDYIVQYIVENTLGPIVRGECRQQPTPQMRQEQATLSFLAQQSQLPAQPQPLSSDEILNLKVLDPAMGSGHFLVAATEYLAKAYHTALLRENGGDENAKGEAELTRYKRLVAERCIYGVDINPMAVELAKLSMWLYTMDKGKPLSFLDHHLKCGNSLIGAYTTDLFSLPKFDNDDTVIVGQGEQLELNFSGSISSYRNKLGEHNRQVSQRPTDKLEDITDKKNILSKCSREIEELSNICNLWMLYCVAPSKSKAGIRHSLEGEVMLKDDNLQALLDQISCVPYEQLLESDVRSLI